MAAELLVGAGAAVVGVLRAVDPVEVGRAVTTVRARHILARGPVLFMVITLDQHSLSSTSTVLFGVTPQIIEMSIS